MCFYFDIVTFDNSQVNNTVMLLHKMHLSEVGLGFPEWGNISVGGIVRCFAKDIELLKQIKYNQELEYLADNNLIIIKSINKLPELYNKVRYIRNRNKEKYYYNSTTQHESNYINREKIRQLDIDKLNTTKYRLAHTSKLQNSHKIINHIKMQSISNKKIYSLNIHREIIPTDMQAQIRNTFKFNSYGLSRLTDSDAGYVYEW